MEKFFKDFLKEHKIKIFFFSFLRLFSFAQVLFWPYAFSNVINIMSKNPQRWQEAVVWAGLMIVNKILEDVIRLRGKFGLEKIGAKLNIAMATYFSEKTKIRKDKKTGEAVQTLKKASEDIDSLMAFYRNDALQLPVNLIAIPLILLNSSPSYLLLLLIYAGLYILTDHLTLKIYRIKLKRFFRAAEVFWGTTYRKTPEVWREREDGHTFASQIEKEGENLYEATIDSVNTNNWRWIFLQVLSSISLGAAVLFVLWRVINLAAPVGDLILVSSYFGETQGTLNIITSAVTQIIKTKLSMKRLREAVEEK